jgi:hypothetical protein
MLRKSLLGTRQPRATVKTLIKIGLLMAIVTLTAVLASASAIWGS